MNDVHVKHDAYTTVQYYLIKLWRTRWVGHVGGVGEECIQGFVGRPEAKRFQEEIDADGG
jgi:hypothetical protein